MRKCYREQTKEPATKEAEVMGISEDANATADKIDELGWCQGVEQDNEGKVCIIGAHNVSYGRHPLTFAIQSEEFCSAIYDYTGMRAVDFNDEPGRTQEEVTQMLRDVAIKYQPDEMRSNGG